MTLLNNSTQLWLRAGFWSDSKQGGTVRKWTKALDRDLQGGSVSYFLHRKDQGFK